ncbi:ATP-dependent helicase HrpA [Pseudomonas fluorescens]|nr:ATP-dependent helicase HrpA [Pseudomonas fluorescens]
MAGGLSLAATTAAMAQLDATSAATTKMNADAQSIKMQTDTMAAITSSYQDSATKVQNSMQQSGKSINY